MAKDEAPARVFDQNDECPLCKVKGRCALASEFKAFGNHVFRACVACGRCSDNGKDKGPLTVHKEG